MKKPPQELVDAFFEWYSNDPHSKNEDYYSKIITKNHLSGSLCANVSETLPPLEFRVYD